MSNFKQKYLANLVAISDIDDFVDAWYKHPQGTLQEYLGLTKEEYEAFAHGEKQLEQKLEAQKHQTASMLKVLSKLV